MYFYVRFFRFRSSIRIWFVVISFFIIEHMQCECRHLLSIWLLFKIDNKLLMRTPSQNLLFSPKMKRFLSHIIYTVHTVWRGQNQNWTETDCVYDECVICTMSPKMKWNSLELDHNRTYIRLTFLQKKKAKRTIFSGRCTCTKSVSLSVAASPNIYMYAINENKKTNDMLMWMNLCMHFFFLSLLCVLLDRMRNRLMNHLHFYIWVFCMCFFLHLFAFDRNVYIWLAYKFHADIAVHAIIQSRLFDWVKKSPTKNISFQNSVKSLWKKIANNLEKNL